MSQNFEFENLVVESVPFSGPDQSSDLFKVTEYSKDFSSNQSCISPSYDTHDKLDSDSLYSGLDKEKVQIHQLEIEKETWRVESLKNGLKAREYERLVEDLKNKLAKQACEKSQSYSKDPSFITIHKSEFAEINYNRLILEKEVAKLKQSLAEKEKEIQDLQSELGGYNKNLPACITAAHSRKSSALATLDSNSLNFHKSEGKSAEKQDLQKRLHESLKINDGLTLKIRELQDKVKGFEGERTRGSPDTCYSVKRNSRASSITNFNQLKKYEAEQDLELYVKKYREAVNEIEKCESVMKNNQQEIEELHSRILKKKNKIRGLVEREKGMMGSIKSLETQLFSVRSVKDTEVDRNQTEITNLKRALDLVHNEKEQLEERVRNTEDLKVKLSTVVQSWDNCKASESKLADELNKLKSSYTSQEAQLTTSNSRLSQLEFLYKNLETNHLSTVKSLQEKESSLLSTLEKSSKLLNKLQKAKTKAQKYKNGTQTNYNDFKDMIRNYMSEKHHSEKLAEQNSELRYVIKSLEETKEKLLIKVDELSLSRSELLTKLNLFEQSAFEKLSTFNAVREDQEKSLNEITGFRLELKRKNEDYILAKAETRKVLSDVSDLTTKLKKAQDQEDFLQKVLKNSENEIKRLNDRLSNIQSQSDEKDQKISTLTSELASHKNQLNMCSADLKKLETSQRLMNLENYSLQSKIEELDKIRFEPNEGKIKEDYFKLVRAYQHLNEELSMARASMATSKVDTQENVRTQKDTVLVEAHLERLQIRLEGVLDEKVSLERKIEFLMLEKCELEKTVQRLRDELEIKERRGASGEKYLKEIQKYKSELRRMENEQEKLKHELCVALGRVNSVQKWAKTVEENANLKSN